MKRIVLLLSLFLAAPLFAVDYDIPKCQKTLGVTWQDIRDCMAALTREYPDQFEGASFGYLPAGSSTPVISHAGASFQPDAYGAEKILWLGSTTKPFTFASTLVAMERTGVPYESRSVDLAPVVRANYIDGDNYGASRNLKESTTLRQILTMTAGFGAETRNEMNNHPLRAWYESYFYQVDSNDCFANVFGTTDPNYQFTGEPGLFNECVYVPSDPGNASSPKVWKGARGVPLFQLGQFMMRYPLDHTPLASGRYAAEYSNLSAVLAGWITEQRTGQTANRFAKDTFFTPLGMNDTFYVPVNFSTPPLDSLNEGVTQAQRNRIAHMINKANGVRDTPYPPLGLTPCNGSYWCDQRDWVFLWPEGGMYSTPSDLFKFLRAFRDNTVPNMSTTTRSLLLTDQLAEDQTSAQSRTAGFGYVRNGISGFVDGMTEGTVLHGGYPGFMMTYDPVRQLSWVFGTQRVMRHEPYFQAEPETFAEARLFNTMLTSMLENVKADNLNFFFDASRAIKRNQNVLRYASRPVGAPAYSDAYKGCKFESNNCDYLRQVDYNSCNTATQSQWYDLSPNQRPMTITASSCRWTGNGSRTDNRPANQQTGPFRMNLTGGDYGRVISGSYPAAYSVSLWVRPANTNNASIFSRTGSPAYGSKTTYQVGIQNGRFVHSSWDASGVKRTVLGDYVVPGQWYNVVAKATRYGQMTLYVNSHISGTSAPIGDFVALGSNEFLIGAAADGLGAFQGDVAVVGVYNQELTPAEIQGNCNGLKYRYGITCG
jgi:CubicO group peptidase (beta-lactamase class C family)